MIPSHGCFCSLFRRAPARAAEGKRFGQTAAAGRIAKESLPALATNEGLQTAYIRAGLADAYRLPSGCSFSARVVGVKLPVKV